MLQLRPYQIEIASKAADTISEYKLVYLSLAVRTGKTLISLYAASSIYPEKVLFLTRKKVIDDIKQQYKDLQKSYLITYTLDVINYEQLHNYIGKPDLIICDESHCMASYPVPSKRAKQVKKIAKDLPIIYLTGSPTPESFSQLFFQFWVSSYSPWSQYKTFYKWAQDYVTIKKKYIYNRAINDYSDANKEKIDADTKHLFISFTQEEAGFTEFVEEEVIYVRMADRTYHLADKLRKEKVLKSKDDVILGDTAVKLMQKLHQLYSGTCITEAGVSILLDYNKANYIWKKFSLIKFAVFYKFKAEYEIMKEVFGKYITQSIEDFNAQPELIYASQIQSGREGLNLSEADALVFYNIDFSHVSYIQARARLQTKDRTTPAKVYWIFSEGGIESRIYAAVQAKSDYQLSHFKKDYLSKIAGSVPKSVSKRS
jgi:hypothetical protein